MVLMIDNYDSFTYNLVQYCGELRQEVRVERNDAITLADIRVMAPEFIIISPGPCTPHEAGASLQILRHFSGKLPILGICLGHQVIGEVFGGKITRAKRPMHGEASEIIHDGTGVFKNLPQRFSAGRYHSLIVEDVENTPLIISAQSDDGEIMSLHHKNHPTFGVQFHPESILTEHGYELLRNFLEHVA